MADDAEYKCYVRGLAWATTEETLKDAFVQYGEVIDTKDRTLSDPIRQSVIKDRETGRSRGFGFVTFKDEQSMKDAIEAMNDKELDGHTINVSDAKTHGSHGGGGGGEHHQGGGVRSYEGGGRIGYDGRGGGGAGY